MSVNCVENCGRFRKVETTVVSADDMRTIGRGVLRLVAGLASQAANTIAMLNASAAAFLRRMSGDDFTPSCPSVRAPADWRTKDRQFDSHFMRHSISHNLQQLLANRVSRMLWGNSSLVL